MSDYISILIVEDDAIIALGLELAVEDRGYVVVGPVATVAEALALVAQGGIEGAVLDASLLDRDVGPVALQLIENGIPFVVHTGVGLPAVLARHYPDLPVMMKPNSPDKVVARLLREIKIGRVRGH